MSSNSHLIEKQRVYACVDVTCTSDTQAVCPSSARDIFTQETGNALIALGKMFTSVPPFNDHIDPNTGQMLISIGKKLKK